jgi:hypothetical protein
MGQHPRTWFSSTTAGFPRADAAWLLRQISSLETPVNISCCPDGQGAAVLAAVDDLLGSGFLVSAFIYIN